ncbi:sulfotransferase family protein [Novosphingobium profundi]|uniref:sulfotransferase family protein n=1 Tax=Novosphingobium profundi TaxID=1774954 RepID=UPI001CFF2665|nr:sulfotransferase [Novosphingobium profundi]
MKMPLMLKKALVANGIDRETFGKRVQFPLRRLARRHGDLPGILIVGAQKAGTTTLHGLLSQHPKIRDGLFKESHFFDKPRLLEEGIGYYRSIFPVLGEGEYTIDSTPMMYHEAVPQIAAGVVPQARVIMILRDPVKRSFSHYLHNVARGREKLSFEEAIAQEEERIRHTAEELRTENAVTYNYRAFSYKERSRYDGQIERWRAAFGPDNVKILIFEEFIKAPEQTTNEVLAWIGLSPISLPTSSNRARNTALVRETLNPETEAALRIEMAPSVQRVRELLGRDVPWSYPRPESALPCNSVNGEELS